MGYVKGLSLYGSLKLQKPQPLAGYSLRHYPGPMRDSLDKEI